MAGFQQQHFDYAARTVITKQLAQLFLVIRDAMLFYQGDEICGRVASQRRLAEMRVLGNEIVRSRSEVSKITTAASRDRYLLSYLPSMLEHYCLTTSFSGFNCTKQSRRTSANYDYVCLSHRQSVSPVEVNKRKGSDILVRCLMLSACLLGHYGFAAASGFGAL
jgi:hypothetical protein